MKQDQQQGKGTPGIVALIISVLIHILLLAPVLYIVVMYFLEYSFFSWHPILSTVGVGLVMMEAVFGISGDAYLNFRLSRSGRVTYHWILNAIGLVLMILGLVIIVVSKNEYGTKHFTSTHGQLGLSAIVISIAVAAFGILANNTGCLYPHVRPVVIKVGHAFGGIAVTILLLATIINGTYKHSFPGTETGRNLTFASFFFAGLLIIAKPLVGAVSRSRVIFKRSRPTNTANT